MASVMHDEVTQAARRAYLTKADELYAEYRAALCHPTWVRVGLIVIWLFLTAFFGHCLQAVNPLAGWALDLLVAGLVAWAICIAVRRELEKPAREAWAAYQAHTAQPLPGDAPKESTVLKKCTGDFICPEDVTALP